MPMPDPGPEQPTEGGARMAAQPAETNYSQSPKPRTLFRGVGKVIPLHRPSQERSGDQNSPEQNQEEAAQTRTPDSGPNSGTGMTLSDFPGDWASVTMVWTDAPEPLCELVGRVSAARREEDRSATDVALACWAVLVLVPRGAFHLASWVLTHPVRLLAAAVLVAVLALTL